jgi:hypothetical protein
MEPTSISGIRHEFSFKEISININQLSQPISSVLNPVSNVDISILIFYLSIPVPPSSLPLSFIDLMIVFISHPSKTMRLELIDLPFIHVSILEQDPSDLRAFPFNENSTEDGAIDHVQSAKA